MLSDAGIANGAIGKWHIAVGSPSHGFAEGKWGGYLGMPINYFAPFKLGFLPKDVPDGSYLPVYIRDAGVEFLERHRDERFFLYFSTYLPHDEIKNEDGSTLTAPDAVVSKYARKIAAMQKDGKDLAGHTNAVYAAMIEETDRSVGTIIDTLDALGRRETTLVIFISDNGGLSRYTSNRPLRGEKCTLYEGGIRVPMIASIKALAHPTRLWMAERLSEGELCVCELTDMVGSDFSTISRHLAVMKQVGIVEGEKRGKQVFYRLKVPCVLDFMRCVEAVIESQVKTQAALLG